MTVRDVALHTNGPLGEDEVRRINDMGLRVVGRLPGGAYRVRGETDVSVDDLSALEFVDNAVDFDPTEKLDAGLTHLASAGAAVAGAGLLTSSTSSTEPVTLLVSLDRHLDPAATTAALGQLGEVLSSTDRRVALRTTADRVGDVARLDGVLHAEVEPDPHTQNNVARGLTRVEPVAVGLGLDGAGEVVGVADSGLDTGVIATVLPDFTGRVLNIRATVVKAPANGADLNNHGTHVCGSIAGDGANSNGTIRGMAPAAQLTVLSMGPNNSTSLSVPADLVADVFTDAYGDGARVHSNSWGSTANLGKYTAFSADVDDFMWDNRDMLVVIAAGNSGSGASTVSAPGTAKNCLTVGASESVRPLPAAISLDPNPQNHDFNAATPPQNVPLNIANWSAQADDPEDIATFSGRGPVNDVGDSRTKPDVVAPGTVILSCRSSISTADLGPDGRRHTGSLATLYADDADGVATHAEAVGTGLPGAPFFGTWDQDTPAPPAGSGALAQQNYFYSSGTSMATPITSGAVAILRQYLRERRGVANPSAALLKALVVNSASVPAGEANTPDNTRGFGFLDVERLLTPAPTGQQTYSDDQELAVATGEVRTLAVEVADPSQPLRVTMVWTDRPGVGLQNRLYLRVVPPGGGAPIDGDITAFPNPTNNVQRVHIAAPLAGTYTIEVHGVDVAFGIPPLAPALRQDFAVAVINGVGFSPKPVDVVQVVDRSGSMGFYSFMVPARERTKQLVDVLRVNDRSGVVQFNNGASTVHPVVPIVGAATQGAIKAAIDTITPAGATSIGGGLQQGLADLAAGGGAGDPQAIVLVSDGHENTPPWVGGGITNSPPAWFGGPDLTEVLPTVPATTRIYTVSLGVASDEVLLQELAAARGGLFQAVHSASDTAKLHEIYVHLQALVGGEEVIAAGSDSVDGLGGGASPQVAPAGTGAGAGGPEMAGLLVPGSADAQALAGVTSLLNHHTVDIDDTVSSVVFGVSWHKVGRPVSFTLVSPSHRVLSPKATGVVGSTYALLRVDDPEPGPWTVRVRAGRRKGRHGYTWGVHGDTPLGLAVVAPERPLGTKVLALHARLSDPDGVVRSSKLAGRAVLPAVTVDDLLKRFRRQLDALKVDLKPDAPDVDANLTKLGVLDLRTVARGGKSLFETRSQEVRLEDDGSAEVEAPLAGIAAFDASVAGVTAGGFAFTRLARTDVRT